MRNNTKDNKIENAVDNVCRGNFIDNTVDNIYRGGEKNE